VPWNSVFSLLQNTGSLWRSVEVTHSRRQWVPGQRTRSGKTGRSVSHKPRALVDQFTAGGWTKMMTSCWRHRNAHVHQVRRCSTTKSLAELVIPLSRLVIAGDRSFAVTGPRLWNTAWGHYIWAVSILVFRWKLKSSVSAILSGHYIVACVACCTRWSLKLLVCYLGHLKNLKCNVMLTSVQSLNGIHWHTGSQWKS